MTLQTKSRLCSCLRDQVLVSPCCGKRSWGCGVQRGAGLSHTESCGQRGELAACLRLRPAVASTCLPDICPSDGCHLRSGVMLSENLLPAWSRQTTKLTARERRNSCCERCRALCPLVQRCSEPQRVSAGWWGWLCTSHGTLPHNGTGLEGVAKCKCIRQQRDGHFIPRSGGWRQNRSLLEMMREDHSRNSHGEAKVSWCAAVLPCPHPPSYVPLNLSKSFVSCTKALGTFASQLPLPSVMMLFILISSTEKKKGLLEG